ncbi:uncharacterized protein K452DRAFT_223874 [Aplosporella prunicola CBS 121167]|uniref:SH3 domain-containing protein n=1 Tax=Aplosporella prunicola CBS 121167 TaxID=1176127 RepID=A0A6A6BM08_9PEZI|nr:uncharacterized protein K452DRAFT_223874 [Aplosporella prunicola CBS 121167]KAF2144325.1 hypothetical protein K452DRAFT_223874 [Aplosporella prunicola CBS 121167]
MQAIQRKFGTFLPRTDDDPQVAEMLHQFKEVDQMLAKLIDALKHWKEAWNSIMTHQLSTIHEFSVMYSPISIIGEPSPTARIPAETPQEVLERTNRLKDVYADLKADLQQDIDLINRRLIHPAQETREHIKPLFKTIQKREDKKLDYERYKSRVEKIEKNVNRSARDESTLQKHQIDLERCVEEYQHADQHIQSHLPAISAAALSLLPFLLASQIEIQNEILGTLYTVMLEFTQAFGFPPPPPDLDDVVATWDADFTPLRREVEGWALLARVAPLPMALPETQHGTLTGLNLRNTASDKFSSGRARIGSRPSFSSQGSGTSPRPTSSRSNSHAIAAPPSPEGPAPPINMASRPKIGGGGGAAAAAGSKPRIPRQPSASTLSPYDGAGNNNEYGRRLSSSSAHSNSDYFARNNSSYQHTTTPGHTPGAIPSLMPSGIGKKKPPPPPPKKRFDSGQPPAEYVVALYDFASQQPGDLGFREGDRIKIVKKEGDASDSWWVGEVRGQRGSFPANYCQAA